MWSFYCYRTTKNPESAQNNLGIYKYNDYIGNLSTELETFAGLTEICEKFQWQWKYNTSFNSVSNQAAYSLSYCFDIYILLLVSKHLPYYEIIQRKSLSCGITPNSCHLLLSLRLVPAFIVLIIILSFTHDDS